MVGLCVITVYKVTLSPIEGQFCMLTLIVSPIRNYTDHWFATLIWIVLYHQTYLFKISSFFSLFWWQKCVLGVTIRIVRIVFGVKNGYYFTFTLWYSQNTKYRVLHGQVLPLITGYNTPYGLNSLQTEYNFVFQTNKAVLIQLAFINCESQ